MPTFIAPSTESDFVELGQTRHGRLFRKHILNKGKLLYPGAPGGVVEIDDKFISTLQKNFDDGVCDIVQVPLAGPRNEHTEEPEKNIGVVTGLEVDGDKVYALIDARKHADDLGSTMLGASAMMSLDYTDTTTLEKKGPTLLHVAVTNRPYVTGLDEYKEVLAASASDDGEPVLLTAATEEKVMTKEELLAELKDKHGYDVAALEVAAAAAAPAAPAAIEEPSADLTALTKTLADTGLVKLANGETIGMPDVVTAMAQLAQNSVTLTQEVEVLKKDKATAEIKDLVRQGRVLPAQEAAMLELKLSNETLFAQLVPAEAIVKLSVETGVVPTDNGQEVDLDKATAEIERYLSLAADRGMPGAPKPVAK